MIEPADPLAKGTLPTAKQAFRDLFIWKQRVVVTNEAGETQCEWHDPDPIANPFKLFAALDLRAWINFFVGFAAWTADAFDFHALSIQTVKLGHYYGRSKTDITTAITLTLLLRSVGAALFGLPGDKWGRKWPLVCNMIILGLLQIATIYCKTFGQFLAVRSLFGLFMGGVYGNAVSMSLEHCPAVSRGLMSAGLSIGVGLLRICFPESQQFIEAKKNSSAKAGDPGAFWRDTKKMLREEWRMCVYCVILMTWFNYFSHTTQDSYTTFMLTQKELSNDGASRASILMKTGACVGGTIIGYLSQFVGRRRAIVCSALAAGALIPAWILPTTERGLSVGGFFLQFFVQGAWGVVPIHLSELSPPAFRSSFSGMTYQLGNMISSPSSQIINAIAESNFVRAPSGDRVEAYGPTMGIATAIIAIGLAITTIFGPEKKGRAFEHAVAGVTEDAGIAKEKDLQFSDEEKGAGMQEERISTPKSHLHGTTGMTQVKP
ncbi:hypothetical protein CFO_g2917 [Ceratocystis platani]|uniref:Carboxylic acid transporter protein like protein n=1 Tax=Ceratocystis fimbriata f. sp. platani TaxID=88771 RepID=A0A0F8B3M7_CERFI|nr:hypothetical protein CFO_g2917 [Ceratocystis platani]